MIPNKIFIQSAHIPHGTGSKYPPKTYIILIQIQGMMAILADNDLHLAFLLMVTSILPIHLRSTPAVLAFNLCIVAFLLQMRI